MGSLLCRSRQQLATLWTYIKVIYSRPHRAVKWFLLVLLIENSSVLRFGAQCTAIEIPHVVALQFQNPDCWLNRLFRLDSRVRSLI